MSVNKAKDIMERVVRTFIGVFLGLYLPVIAGADSLAALVDLSTADKAAAAGVAAVVTLLMGIVGANVGPSDDASVLKK